MFNRETDVAWDAAGNIFVSDGYNNKRVVKFDKNGKFLKEFGSRGSGPGQFEDVHTIQVDHQGNVYVGDRANKRLSVFDNDGNYKTGYINVGSPWAICITPGQHQYLYSSNSTGTTDMENNGEIYKMELDGRILGKFGKGGKANEGIHGRPRTRLPDRQRSLRRRDLELAGAKALPASDSGGRREVVPVAAGETTFCVPAS